MLAVSYMVEETPADSLYNLMYQVLLTKYRQYLQSRKIKPKFSTHFQLSMHKQLDSS